MKLNIIHPNSSGLAGHLGGHENETHIDDGALEFMIKKFGVKSYLDVGCGPGGMVELAITKGLTALGVDGDFTLERKTPNFLIHDYSTGPAPLGDQTFDMAWSCEFLEHVDEKYIDNFMDSFKHCKRIVCTHAVPGQGGHHHVNEQPADYWLNTFAQRGFLFDMIASNELRHASTMVQKYIRETGLVFFNNNLP